MHNALPEVASEVSTFGFSQPGFLLLTSLFFKTIYSWAMEYKGKRGRKVALRERQKPLISHF